MQINWLVLVLILIAVFALGFGLSFAIGPKGAKFGAEVGTTNGNGTTTNENGGQ